MARIPVLGEITALADSDEFYVRRNSVVPPDKRTSALSIAEYLRTALVETRSARNLLINPRFNINQRAFAGGALAADVYGFDGWKAGSGGCTITVASGVVSLAGPLVQIIEDPELAGKLVTISFENLSTNLSVTIGDSGANTVTGSIAAGSGRRSVSLTVPASVTGNVYLTLNPAATVTFKNAQLNAGRNTGFDLRNAGEDLMACRRYFQAGKGALGGYAPATTGVMPQQTFPLSPAMRASPTMATANVVVTGTGTLGVSALDVSAFEATVTKTSALGSVGATFDWTADASL